VPIQALVVQDLKPAPGQAQAPREQEGVYVVEAGKAVFRPLKTGLLGDLTVEVLEGLKAGEAVIVGPFKALRELKEQDPVRPEDRKKAG
jgi:HlyD family secretion protein